MLTEQYADILCSGIRTIYAEEKQKIMKAAEYAAEVIENDGLIYIFGCGHSHMLAEETFYRAGGLACVHPVFYEPLMLHEGAAYSSVLEKEEGLYNEVLKAANITHNDLLICISSSGINSVPVEYADCIRKKGIPVIGISSYEYLTQEAKNPLKKHLSDVCTVSINNHVPHGDACLEPEGLGMKMTPASTVFSTYIVNSVLAEAVSIAAARGVDVPVYKSGNIPGGAQYNKALIDRYQRRIKCL